LQQEPPVKTVKAVSHRAAVWNSGARSLGFAVWLGLLVSSCAESGASQFVRSDGSPQVLTHVRVIDGTGAPAKDDQTVVIQQGRIAEVTDGAHKPIPQGESVVDLRGRTVMPGLVGMHEHLFYQAAQGTSSDVSRFPAQSAFAKLYLASGVTTIRTAGTIDFDGDLRLKQRIDNGREPGPTIHLTSPYLDARGARPDVEGVARDVASWAEQGATSIKAASTLRSAELRAAVRAAHERGLRITGHLCAVGFREAAAMGIDNVEHGLAVDTEFYSAKQTDVCPDWAASVSELTRMEIRSAEVSATIAELVNHGVAVTSTLAVLETFTARESALDPRTPTVLSSGLRDQYEARRALQMSRKNASARMWSEMLRKEMEFERAFVKAGGLLLAGVDPTGWGGVVAGFGDQRELELLVEAGFTPEEAIKIATANGARFLRERDHVGKVGVGQRADLVVVRGNPSVNISDVRNVEWVIKDGIAYDPTALIEATAGAVGAFDLRGLWSWPVNLLSGARSR
jgi:imidazolonepropionase-like amidohydrolase